MNSNTYNSMKYLHTWCMELQVIVTFFFYGIKITMATFTKLIYGKNIFRSRVKIINFFFFFFCKHERVKIRCFWAKRTTQKKLKIQAVNVFKIICTHCQTVMDCRDG